MKPYFYVVFSAHFLFGLQGARPTDNLLPLCHGQYVSDCIATKRKRTPLFAKANDDVHYDLRCLLMLVIDLQSQLGYKIRHYLGDLDLLRTYRLASLTTKTG